MAKGQQKRKPKSVPALVPEQNKGDSRDKAAKGRQKLSKGRGKKGKALMPDLNDGQSRDKVGKIFGVGARYVSDAKAIKKVSPKLFEQVKSGEKTITQVNRELKERKRESRRRKKHFRKRFLKC